MKKKEKVDKGNKSNALVLVYDDNPFVGHVYNPFVGHVCNPFVGL